MFQAPFTPIVIRRKQILHGVRSMRTTKAQSTKYYQDILQSIAQSQDCTIMVNGQPKLVPLRVPTSGEYVVIDAINVVCSVDTFTTADMQRLNTTPKEILALNLNNDQSEWLHAQILHRMESDLSLIFGSEFSNLIPKGSTYLQYAHGYTVYSPEREILLNVGIGGERQNNTVLFSLTGMGCKLAQDGWESRLYDFLNFAQDGKITRIDLAHDDLDGHYSSFDWANQKETDNAFMLPKTRNRPACTIAGEFKHGDPLNKGLTLYVGSRKNGKVIRCYEKGKQLGDTSSAWFRSELEIHAKARIIPFDVLLRPTEFFCGAYPYCLELIEIAKKHMGDHTPQTVDKMPATKRQAHITLNRAISLLKHQFGKYLKAFGEIFTKDNEPDYEKIFSKVTTDQVKDYYPKRLRLTANYFKNSPVVVKKDDLLRQFHDDIDDEIPPEFLIKSNNFALVIGQMT